MNVKINQYIENYRNEMLNLLERIVNMDSASDNKKGADFLGDYLAKLYENLGFSVEKVHQDNYGNHLICRLEGKGKKTLLIGHMDTALPEGTAAAKPFHIEGNKGFGPGAADMKAGLVAMYFALKSILETTGSKPNVTVLMNSDEEPGSPTSRELIWREASGAARVFILEGSRNGSLVTRRKGVGIFLFKFKGRAAHAGAEPEKGRSAIVEMGHKILDLAALNDYDRGVTVNVGVIKGGTYPYVVAEEAVAQVDCRIPTNEDGERIKVAFDEIAQKIYIPGVKTEWEGSFHRPAMERTQESGALCEFVIEVGKLLGIHLEDRTVGGSSDANLTSAIGVPSLCGMGAGAYAQHSLNEYVEIDSIYDRTKLLAQTLYKLHKGGSEIGYPK